VQAGTFLYNMQHLPSQLGVHGELYGGFARAVTVEGAWLPEMDVQCLHGLVGLRMLCEVDPGNRGRYEAMMADAVNFYRPGLEGCFDHFSPEPSGDGGWHRIDGGESVTYDDTLAYALFGLYDYEGWSASVQKTYAYLNSIGASPVYPAYNGAVCWAGYLDASAKTPACDYYDAVAAGILAPLRRNHDRSSYEFSAKIIREHADEFMFWGVKHADFAPVEEKQAMATVCWVGQLLLGYEPPLTRFTQVLASKGENITLFPVAAVGEQTIFGEGGDVKAIVLPSKAEETLLEPGYVASDYVVLHMFAPVRRHDKLRVRGADYEALTVQEFAFKGETAYRKVACRRMLMQ
jgi:hypothetical protein